MCDRETGTTRGCHLGYTDTLNRKKSKPQVNTVFRSDNLEISDPILRSR